MSLTTAERDESLQLVEDIQKTRAGDNLQLKPDEVPAVLLPYQQEWGRDLAPVRLAQKSRRIGFTWGALAAEAALEAAWAGGMDQFYMGYNQAMAAEFIGDVAFFARAYQMAISSIDVTKLTEILGDERKDIVTYRIKFASGWKVEALSSSPYNWRGRQGHARIDEAAFHLNLAEVVKGALAFLMWGGRVDVVSTHDGDDSDFNRLVKEIQAGKLGWSLHTITFNDALAQGFYERVCLVKGVQYSLDGQAAYVAEIRSTYPSPEDAAEELDCVPKRGAGAYFTRLLLEHCHVEGVSTLRWTQPATFVIEPNRIQVAWRWIAEHLKPVIDAMPTDKRTVYGQDFARDGDLSVIWVLQDQGGGRWKQAFAVELRAIPFDVQKEITHYIMSEIPLFHHAKFDARGNGQSHAEAALQAFGSQRVDCVMLTAQWYAEHFPRYRQALEGQSIGIGASEDVIADHRLIQLNQGRPQVSGTRIKGSDGQYRHGDSAIAAVLAFAATQLEAQPPAGESRSKPSRRRRAPVSGGLIRKPEPLGIGRPL